MERKNTKIAKYWARIPVAGKRGGVWVAIKPHEEIKPEYEICESKLIRRNGRFFLYLTVQKYVSINIPSNPHKTAVIAVDIGEANPLTSVVLRDGKITSPKFLAGEVRAIRTLYARIRKMIGRKKVKHGARVLDRIDRESKKVTDVLHKATREIIEQAKQLREEGYNVIIVYGNLKVGVRKPRIKGKTRCRKNNRKIHQMPSYKIKHMLTYKALWEGIPCVGINEAYTTKTCHRCGSMNTVIRKGLFKCKDCGQEYNRDLNASINIGNRLLGYMLNSRGAVNPPLTSPVNIVPKGNFLVVQQAREEAPSLVAE